MTIESDIHDIVDLLVQISITLKSMKIQEREYWESWKRNKIREGGFEKI